MTYHLDESLRIENQALRALLCKLQAEVDYQRKELERYADACNRCPRAGGRHS